MLSLTNQQVLFLPLWPNSDVYGNNCILWLISNMNKTNKKSNGNNCALCIEHADIETTKQLTMPHTTSAMAIQLRSSNQGAFTWVRHKFLSTFHASFVLSLTFVLSLSVPFFFVHISRIVSRRVNWTSLTFFRISFLLDPCLESSVKRCWLGVVYIIVHKVIPC